MNDVTMATIHTAMRGLAMRQRTLADNIANLETPGFLAGRVDFEASLRDAMSVQRPDLAEIGSSRSTEATGMNGNNVNLDQETLAMVDTNLRYSAMTEAMNAKFRLLRTAIGNR
jgi:flagellar basal-body rod protein FlgB